MFQKLFQKLTLKNGLRVILAENPRALTLSGRVVVAAGSKYESKNQNGISHFLEHLCFQGTKKRPTPLDVAKELDRIGGHSNAFTSREYTGYYIVTHPEHLERVVDLLSDIYLNSIFNPENIEKEKNVVVEEINLHNDQPDYRVTFHFMELLYGDQPAGWRVIGTKENVKKFSREDIIRYHNAFYRAENTVVVLSGNFSSKKAKKLIESHFAPITPGKGPEKPPTQDAQNAPACVLETRPTEQTRLILGFRGLNLNDPRRFAADVLCTVLGSGQSSRLFQKIRNQMGAAYGIYTEQDNFTDHGFISTYAGVEIEKTYDALREILREHKKIAEHGINLEELQRAKEQLKSSVLLSLETTNAIAGALADQEILTGKILTPEEFIEKINAVTAQDVQTLAKELFVPYTLNLAIVGPYKDKKEFEKIIEAYR